MGKKASSPKVLNEFEGMFLNYSPDEKPFRICEDSTIS